ncbi:hypothetical protein VJ923_11225 [Adlercreutzia sp. R25]|uniref:Uncharacterized protein n=1 Tax=Adlercreutzia shanghongiae TaxID=3111773 RepID=A0ABU6J164_9ACTN|nr:MULTISPECIES: hypothetical protein [unclassified Adlercreutzia]MEC4273728.1 hypothetical protein [Adlercreutzia sp. R25]MEC4295871.1 hypothetical protein [Adlercreutzia sp. R22]
MRSFGSGLAASTRDDMGKKDEPVAQNGAEAGSPAGMTGQRKIPRSVKIVTWVVRACFTFVFVVNAQCALGFALTPEAYMGAYELSGVPGRVGVQGIGIAFLMWNCTYPAFIAAPRRFTALGVVILAQQVVGLIGESTIRATLPADHDLLASSIDLFIAFDALGLFLMAASFAALKITERRQPSVGSSASVAQPTFPLPFARKARLLGIRSLQNDCKMLAPEQDTRSRQLSRLHMKRTASRMCKQTRFFYK